MLKLLLACVLLAVATERAKSLAVGEPAKDPECSITNGKLLTTFSGMQIPMRFGCKVHAIRNTVCGKYRLTISPTLRLGTTMNDRTALLYYIDRLYINVTHIRKEEDTSAKVVHKDVEMYLSSMTDEPVDDRGGKVVVNDTFDITGCRGEITIKEKKGAFTIKYFSYDYHHAETAAFSFICHDEVFEPSDSYRQMCGNLENTTAEEIMGEDRLGLRTFLVKSIFTKEGIRQTERFCDRAQDILASDNCKDVTGAVKQCTPILYDDKFIKCTSEEMDNPDDKHKSLMDFFKACVQYVCQMSNKDTCKEFKKQTKDCPKIPGITNEVQCRDA